MKKNEHPKPALPEVEEKDLRKVVGGAAGCVACACSPGGVIGGTSLTRESTSAACC